MPSTDKLYEVRLDPKAMDTDQQIQPPKEMRQWLFQATGDLQCSEIAESKWWWDFSYADEYGPISHVTFYFRQESTALLFKLTWGAYDFAEG